MVEAGLAWVLPPKIERELDAGAGLLDDDLAIVNMYNKCVIYVQTLVWFVYNMRNYQRPTAAWQIPIWWNPSSFYTRTPFPSPSSPLFFFLLVLLFYMVLYLCS